jgi:hypothetical protein
VPTACCSAKTSPARIDSTIAGVPPSSRDRVVEIAVADRVDERHRAAARHRRDLIADQLAAHDQHPGGLRSAGELVRREEDRVLVIVAVRPGCRDADRHVGPGRRVVPERQRAVSVQQRRDRAGVGEDAGDVGGGGEAADPQRPPGVAIQLAFQVRQVDVTVGVRTDDYHVGDRLAPRQLVRVMLVRADEYHRQVSRRDARGELVPVIEPARDTQLEDTDQLAHRRCRARAAKDDQVIGSASDRVPDDPPRVLSQPGGLQPGARALGVGVGVPGQDRVADEILDEVQRPARRGVVRVGDPPRAERAVNQLTLADDPAPDPVDQR